MPASVVAERPMIEGVTTSASRPERHSRFARAAGTRGCDPAIPAGARLRMGRFPVLRCALRAERLAHAFGLTRKR